MILKNPDLSKVYTSNPSLKERARYLRNNMTPEEKHLWYDFLKDLPVTFNRQKVVGIYILDFYCDKKKICIEIDGLYHLSDVSKRHDKIRDNYLKGLGINVIRYTNFQINNNFESVCKDIRNILHKE